MSKIDFNVLNLKITPIRMSGVLTLGYRNNNRQPGMLPYRDRGSNFIGMSAEVVPTLINMEATATE